MDPLKFPSTENQLYKLFFQKKVKSGINLECVRKIDGNSDADLLTQYGFMPAKHWNLFQMRDLFCHTIPSSEESTNNCCCKLRTVSQASDWLWCSKTEKCNSFLERTSYLPMRNVCEKLFTTFLRECSSLFNYTTKTKKVLGLERLFGKRFEIITVKSF